MIHQDSLWSKSIGAATFKEAMYNLAIEARLAIQAHQVAISYIPEGDLKNAIHVPSLSQKYEKYNSYNVMPTGEGIWSWIVNERLQVFMTDDELKSHPAWKNFCGMKDERGLEHPPMRGWLAVPILQQAGEVIGVLQATDKYEGEFNERDLKEFTHIAKRVAPTFELHFANSQLEHHTHELEKRTAELDKSNEALMESNVELKQFAYVVSHDLQSPMRTISTFSQFLLEEYGDKLDEVASDYINRIVHACTHMQGLTKDLLTYSKVESRSRPFEEVDLEDVLDAAIDILQESIKDSRGEVIHTQLPIVLGDMSQLTQVFQNFIGNGLKYHGKEPPKIHVTADEIGDQWKVSFQDNGIGIDPEHHDRIFEIFRRLHTQKEFPGSGIGLAICQRIIQRHGGTVGLESEVGIGSKFHFTLPTLATLDNRE